MEEKVLSEEKYQKSKKKLITIAIIIFVVGLILGLSLIITGKVKSTRYINYNKSSEVLSNEDLEDKLDDLEEKLEEELEENGFSNEYYKLQRQIDKIRDKVNINDAKEFFDDIGIPNIVGTATNTFNKARVIPYYMAGGFIIFSTSLVSIFLIFIAKRREIEAFSTQQSLPVEKEKIEELSPSLGKAAKEISKGVNEGVKDEE